MKKMLLNLLCKLGFHWESVSYQDIAHRKCVNCGKVWEENPYMQV